VYVVPLGNELAYAIPHGSVFQLLPYKLEADVLGDQPQEMGFRNLVFQAEIVEQRFRAVVLPHHDQQPSDRRKSSEA